MDDIDLQEFLKFLSFASISTDPAYRGEVQKCGEWVLEKFTKLGLEAKLHATAGHPIVTARTPPDPKKRTLLIYGHYDVQPVDPLNLWEGPPFEPQQKGGKVFARGATDNKGQIFGHILGVQKALQQGPLPVNVIFLVEGEEECGSGNLTPFVEANQEFLKCDCVLLSDTGMIAPRTPTISYGLRGLCALEVTLRGPTKDLHSGEFGGAVVNPALVLARLLTTLHDSHGKIAVEGFYDQVAPIQPWEKEAWSKLPLNEKELLHTTGAPQLGGEAGFEPLERIWGRPTIEINGLTSGYQGRGTKTVLPSKASAKLTCRLVPNQTPQEILQKVSDHLRKHCPPTVELQIELGDGGLPYLIDPQSPYIVAAVKALKHIFPDRETAFTRSGGSIPVIAELKRILNVDVVMVGWALPDSNIHSPNENFPVENLEYGLRFNREFLKFMSQP
jgi:acetylornithine deacetylase/succinyl-diaminopimelate desuccinylase-like protein